MEDRISDLPSGIIDTVLCLLSIQEVARTSILSKEWRYRWTRIPKLEFKVSIEGDDQQMSKRCNLFNAIYQVILRHQSPIYEFALLMPTPTDGISDFIDNILFLLSKKNTVKILKIEFNWHYKLPLSLFSLHQLTDLFLSLSVLEDQPSFNGFAFASLTTLYVDLELTSKKALLHLLSSCPLLKRLTLNIRHLTVTYGEGGCTAIDVFECLPVIEYLSVWFHPMCFDLDKFPKVLPTTLVHLKYLCIQLICFCHKYAVPSLVLLLRSSPNLEKLKLEMVDKNRFGKDEIGSVSLKEYSDIMLERLNELEIINFRNAENELDFVKLILAKSPILKKARIFLSGRFAKDEEELRVSETLLRLTAASTMVKTDDLLQLKCSVAGVLVQRTRL